MIVAIPNQLLAFAAEGERYDDQTLAQNSDKIDEDKSLKSLDTERATCERACHVALHRVRFAATCTVSQIPCKPADSVLTPWVERAGGAPKSTWADYSDDDDDDFSDLWELESCSWSTTPLTSPSPSIEMSGQWSSAATGKPQLSYADRLRRAKEGAAYIRSTSRAPDEASEVKKQSPSNNKLPNVGTKGNDPSTPSSANHTSGSASPDASTHGTVPSSPGASHTPAEESSKNSAPAVNVWEARKQQLQQKQLSLEQQIAPKTITESSSLSASAVPLSAPTAPRSQTKDQKADANLKGSPSLPPIDDASWPQSHASRSSAVGDASRLDDANNTSKAVPTQATNLESLDVSLVRSATAESKMKKGKQWVPIVPTITHNTPPAGNPKRPKSQGPLQGSSAIRQPVQSRRVRSQEQNRRDSHYMYTQQNLQSSKTKPRVGEIDGSNGNIAAQNRSDNGSTSSTPKSPKHTELRRDMDNLSISSSSPDARYMHSRHRSWSSARGSRGRAYSTRKSSGESDQSNSASSNASPQRKADDVPAPGSDIATEGRHQSALIQGRPKSPPTGPRAGNGGNYGRPGGIMGGHGNSSRSYNPAFPALSGPYWAANPPQGSGIAMPMPMPTPMPVPLDQTAAEFAPKGTDSANEPTHVLLMQIEFYFSHQNLQGDFFLRKNMDSQGYVPLDFLAGFNRVKHIVGGENADLLRETIGYSKVLQMDQEQKRVRKAFGWESYVLEGGQHPMQPETFQPMQQMLQYDGTTGPNGPLMVPFYMPAQSSSPSAPQTPMISSQGDQYPLDMRHNRSYSPSEYYNLRGGYAYNNGRGYGRSRYRGQRRSTIGRGGNSQQWQASRNRAHADGEAAQLAQESSPKALNELQANATEPNNGNHHGHDDACDADPSREDASPDAQHLRSIDLHDQDDDVQLLGGQMSHGIASRH